MLEGNIVIYGPANSAAGYELRDFLTRNCSEYDWVELSTDREAQTLAGVSGLTDSRLPMCILSQNLKLYCPSLRELATALDWFRGPRYECYDLAIFGAGPAGLSAAIYGASEGLRTLVVEKVAVGGQAGSTSTIENYMGSRMELAAGNSLSGRVGKRCGWEQRSSWQVRGSRESIETAGN